MSKISYTRDFLLSLAELDICKKLPVMFDSSFLSEFEVISEPTIRNSFNFPLQCVTQKDHDSSSLSVRGDARNYSCHANGACDNASSIRNDRVAGLQHDIYSGQHCKSIEHDGLLGGGSFPRPSPQNLQANYHHQFTRALLHSHAPFPYKAAPQNRRRANDSYNNETFGSPNCHSGNRSEEERKRRASFDLMRKESKERMGLDKVNSVRDEDVLEKGTGIPMSLGNGADRRATPHVPNNGADSSCSPQSASISRPPVPPGFLETAAEKCLSASSTVQHYPSEAGSELQNNGLDANGNAALNLSEFSIASVQGIDSSARQLGSSAILAHMGTAADPCEFSGQSDPNDGAIQHHRADDALMNMEAGESSPPHTTSLLNKIFASGLMLTDSDSSSFVKDAKEDETWIIQTVQSSKFAPWFHEGEKKKQARDPPPSRAGDLLSLIGGCRNIEPPDFKIHKLENATNSWETQTDEPGRDGNVLTCEDVEQSILREITTKPITLQPGMTTSRMEETDTKASQWGADACDRASQHLLSLLRGGTGPSSHEEHDARPASPTAEPDERRLVDGGKNLTLEALFGSAFMNQLQSAGLPPDVASPDEDTLLTVYDKSSSRAAMVQPPPPPSLGPFTLHHQLNNMGQPPMACPPDPLPCDNNALVKLLAAEYHFHHGNAQNLQACPGIPNFPWHHHPGGEPPGFEPHGHASPDAGPSYPNYNMMGLGGPWYPDPARGDLHPNFGYCGNPLQVQQGCEGGRLDGMAFQRMMEMQLRAKP